MQREPFGMTPAEKPLLPAPETPETGDALKRVKLGPEQPISGARFFKNALVALGVCLAMFLVAEGIVRFLVVLAHPLQSHAVEYDRKYQLAQAPVAGNKPVILILGDSLIDFALYPELLRVRLKAAGIDAEVRNLAVPGNTFENASFLLKTVVAKGIHPSLVIYDVHPRLYNQSSYKATGRGRDFESSYLGTCKATRPNTLGRIGCWFQSNFYLIGYRRFLKDEVSKLDDTLLKPKKRLKFATTPYPRTEVSPQGWAPGYEIRTEPEFRRKFSEPEYLSKVEGDIGHFRWTDAHFMPFRDYCRQHRIPVMMVWLPEHPMFTAYYRQMQVDEKTLQGRLQALFQSSGVDFVNMHRDLTDTLDFHTPDHVNTLGAIQVTDKMAARLISDYRNLLQPNAQSGGEKQ